MSFKTTSGGQQEDGRIPQQDPRLQPTPDYGTLGPGSDAEVYAPKTNDPRGVQPRTPAQMQTAKARVMLALALGVWVLGLGISLVLSHQKIGILGANPKLPASPNDTRALNALKPQRQAEALLEMAVRHSDGAVQQISARAPNWNGKMQWTPQIASLTTAALNSDDMRVRESGIEVELAAYGLAKNQASLSFVLQTAESKDHGRKIWALWALGLMANRGVQPVLAIDALGQHLRDEDADSRMWAVEGLALSGNDEALRMLLAEMRDDAAPSVRERAACGLAAAGMFTQDQRMTAVPQLIADAGDPQLDAQTKAWAFQALADITHQRLPNDAAAWKKWYTNRE